MYYYKTSPIDATMRAQQDAELGAYRRAAFISVLVCTVTIVYCAYAIPAAHNHALYIHAVLDNEMQFCMHQSTLLSRRLGQVSVGGAAGLASPQHSDRQRRQTEYVVVNNKMYNRIGLNNPRTDDQQAKSSSWTDRLADLPWLNGLRGIWSFGRFVPQQPPQPNGPAEATTFNPGRNNGGLRSSPPGGGAPRDLRNSHFDPRFGIRPGPSVHEQQRIQHHNLRGLAQIGAADNKDDDDDDRPSFLNNFGLRARQIIQNRERELARYVGDVYDSSGQQRWTPSTLQTTEELYLRPLNGPRTRSSYDISTQSYPSQQPTNNYGGTSNPDQFVEQDITTPPPPPPQPELQQCQCCTCHQGPVGPAGEPGLPGADGKPGQVGPMGIRGRDAPLTPPKPPKPCENTCARADPGLRGLQGRGGGKGLPGDPGRPGTTGPPGDDGGRGEQGPKGRPGFFGLPGKRGTPGKVLQMRMAPGQPGPKGKAGEYGIRGKDGKPAEPPKRGPQGPNGPDGEAGFPGKPGPYGEDGPQGEEGLTGSCQHCPEPRFPPGYFTSAVIKDTEEQRTAGDSYWLGYGTQRFTDAQTQTPLLTDNKYGYRPTFWG